MEEPSEFIDEQGDPATRGRRNRDPGWELVRFDVEDEPSANGEEEGGESGPDASVSSGRAPGDYSGLFSSLLRTAALAP